MDNDSIYQRSSYSFDLPKTSIATAPIEPRDASRLMVLRREAKTIEHRIFADLPGLLPQGTLLVRNNSRVIPARMRVSFENGSVGEIFFLRREDSRNGQFFVRPGKKFPEGETVTLTLSNGDTTPVQVLKVFEGGERRLQWPASDLDLLEILEKAGETPLPPYIGAQEDTPELRERYQTTYAATKGSVAAPTAGLHFTQKTFEDLAARDIKPVDVTLHVGAGTFLPVKANDVRTHHMHSEWFHVDAPVVQNIQDTWDNSQPILAVGTTSLRVLEHAYREGLFVGRQDTTAETEIFVYPPQTVQSATMLLTNFHLPESTLLMLVCAFAGDSAFVLNAYKSAVVEGYRFYSFGDAMLILP